MTHEDSVLPPLGFRQRGPEPVGTRLLIVRHGECYANSLGLAGGHKGDGGLTEKGIAQARALRDRLVMSRELMDAAAFYTSTMPRAIQTGEIIADGLPSHLTPVQDPHICELSVGEGDGLTWTEFVERYGVTDWDKDPHQICAPGGESLLSFYERSVAALRRLINAHPGELVVLVAHGGFIEQALKLHYGVEGHVRLRPRTENCSMTEIEFAPEYSRLLRYNDVAPLPAA
jgi:2,3-bisphosphoglycerate-dependent phosphoglycerate mutase